MYKSEDPDMDKVWYEEVQGSFGKTDQEHNLCERRKITKASRRWTQKRKKIVIPGPS